MSLTKIDLTLNIGAELKVDAETLVSGSVSDEIRSLLQERGVLVVRRLNLDKDQQLAFSRTLGDVQMIPEAGDGANGLQNISLDPKISLSAEYLRGSVFWHIDGAMDDVPNFAATLNAKKLSDEGGATYFANTYAAYDALSDAEKAEYDKLKVVHSLYASQIMVTPQPTHAAMSMWMKARPPKIHPLVWTHTTGRKSLVIGASADYVEGMDIQAGRILLCKLREWATQPQFVYRHEWEVGDLIIWDNSGSMHCVTPYPLDSGRLLLRTTILGDEAVA